MARTYKVFRGNERELFGFLGRFDEIEAMLKLWDVRNRDKFDAFLDETDRLLHNYLSAAASLRDHTRRLWQKHPPEDSALRAEYDRRVASSFENSPVANFVQRLRNHSMHSRLPIARGQLSLSRDQGQKYTIILARNELLEWNGWNASARNYIKSAPESLDLREIIRSYSALVHEFNGWYGQAFVEGHLAAFGELNARQAEYAALLIELGIAPPPENP